MSKPSKIDTAESINSLAFTPISDLEVNTLSKVTGTLEKDYSSMLSLMTKAKCIGYTFEEKKWVSRHPFKNKHSDKKWKVVSEKNECKNFYIKDESGKIRVDAYGIKMYLEANENKKVKNKSHLIENLVLDNDTKYIVVGTVSKRGNNKIEFSKGSSGDGLIILDEPFFNLYVKPNPILRIGCAIFLVLLAVVFLYILLTGLF